MYDNFSDNLFPFLYSKGKIILEENSTLQLIDEIEYFNGFFGDILKIKVTDGYYKGKTGYILEESVKLSDSSIKNGVAAFFDKDTYFPTNNVMIKERTKCKVVESKVYNGDEVITLLFEEYPLKNLTIDLNNKNRIHYIINKASEISYFLRKGYDVIRVLDTNSLLPVDNAISNGFTSDKEGFMYIKRKRVTKNYMITKDGFTQGHITKFDSNDNIFLCFMEPLKKIKFYDDRTTIHKENNYQFIINNQNRSAGNDIGIIVIENDDLSLLCNPTIKRTDIVIIGGFFIEKIDNYPNITCEFNIEQDNIIVMFFDNKISEWIKIAVEKKDAVYYINNLKPGYYIMCYKNNNTYTSCRIKNEIEKKQSRIYLKEKYGDLFLSINTKNKSISEIPKGIYEILLFDPIDPYEIYQNTLNLTSSENLIDIKKLIEKKQNKEPKSFDKIYFGYWERRAVKRNGIYSEEKNILEFLGNMKLGPSDLVSFEIDDHKLSGYIEIISRNKMNIYLTDINILITNQGQTQTFKVSSSLFTSKLMIPAFYKYYAGVMQISFDNIYFLRKRLYLKKADNIPKLIMENITYGNPKFPSSEKDARYKLFFVQ